jgi:hypothetical protein
VEEKIMYKSIKRFLNNNGRLSVKSSVMSYLKCVKKEHISFLGMGGVQEDFIDYLDIEEVCGDGEMPLDGVHEAWVNSQMCEAGLNEEVCYT